MFGINAKKKNCPKCQAEMKLRLKGTVLKVFVVEELMFFGGLAMLVFIHDAVLRSLGGVLFALSFVVPYWLIMKMPKPWRCKACGYEVVE